MPETTDDRLSRMEAKIDRLAEQMLAGFERLQLSQAGSNERLARLEGRIEEQSSMLQLVVASRMGRKSAAE